MSALAAALFTLSTLTAFAVLLQTLLVYGREVQQLRRALDAAPASLQISWVLTEPRTFQSTPQGHREVIRPRSRLRLAMQPAAALPLAA